MRNSHLLASNIDVMPLMDALARQPELWDNEQYLKQFYPFAETDIIYLRFPRHEPDWDNEECVNYPAWHKLPQASPHIFALMNIVQGVRLGRVMINRLAPDAVIPKHQDLAAHTRRWRRYHLVLHGNAIMRVGDETIPMRAGMLFWLDNRAVHEVANQSNDDRLSMVIDIQTLDVEL